MDHLEFKISLGYTVTLSQKTKQTNQVSCIVSHSRIQIFQIIKIFKCHFDIANCVVSMHIWYLFITIDYASKAEVI